MKASASLRLQQRKIKNAVFQAQKKAARELVQVLIDVIRTRTRLLGELVDGKPIPGNEESTIKYRERYSKNLDSDTTPQKSNATATGQLLNSMKGKAVGTKITIDLKTGRRRELSGSKSKLTNTEVNEYYENRDLKYGPKKREWFGLQDNEINELIDYATDLIKEEIKKVLK